MSFFKILKGLAKDLPAKTVEGQVYFTTDTGNLLVDLKDANTNTLTRKMVSGLPYVEGTSCGVRGSWLGEHPGLQLSDGLTIVYKPNIDGNDSDAFNIRYQDQSYTLSYTTLNLNGFGWKKCYISDVQRLTNEPKANTVLLLVYDSELDNGNGGWLTLTAQKQIEPMFNDRGIDEEIIDEESTNLPTTKAVVKYIKSLSYGGHYEIEI